MKLEVIAERYKFEKNLITNPIFQIFTSHYNTFLDAKIVYTFGNLDQKLYRDYEVNIFHAYF